MSAIQTKAPARTSSLTAPMPLAPPVTGRGGRRGERAGAGLADLGQHFQVSAGGFGDGFRVSGVDGGEVDQVAAYAQGARAGARKLSAVCSVTPPVGMSLRCGKGASSDLR
jgi:hypothetical protein